MGLNRFADRLCGVTCIKARLILSGICAFILSSCAPKIRKSDCDKLTQYAIQAERALLRTDSFKIVYTTRDSFIRLPGATIRETINVPQVFTLDGKPYPVYRTITDTSGIATLKVTFDSTLKALRIECTANAREQAVRLLDTKTIIQRTLEQHANNNIPLALWFVVACLIVGFGYIIIRDALKRAKPP